MRLTIDNALEDVEVQKEYGRRALRQFRIQRITQEAIEQSGILSQEDLSKYLSCNVRTIKRDIREIKQRGIEVITRGVLHNIGRGQTHKSKIVGLYLEGKTYSEIRRMTQHSTGAIKRYLQDFIKVLMSLHHRIINYKDIQSVSGLSENLVSQYIGLIYESRKDRRKSRTMQELIKQWKRAGSLKKSKIEAGMTIFPMIRGGI